MKQDNSNLVLNIQHGLTGEVIPLFDFFKVSHYTQTCMLEDFVLPLLHEGQPVYISVGEKK